ncbi:hypothetical protein [Candidatus Alkanophaga liquidiphilum]
MEASTVKFWGFGSVQHGTSCAPVGLSTLPLTARYTHELASTWM